MNVTTDPIEAIRDRWKPKHYDSPYASTTYVGHISVLITATLEDAVRDIPVLLAEIDRLTGRPA